MFSLSKFEWLVLTGALLLCPGISFGADPAQVLFDRLDTNKDGSLSAQELASEEAKNLNWIAVDRNRDGRITRDEFGTMVASPAPSAPSAAAGGSAAEPAPSETPKTR